MKSFFRLTLLAVFVASAVSAQAAATPSSAIKNFLVQPVQAATVQVRLSWAAPISGNFSGVKILRRSGGPCPASVNDSSAVIVYDGNGTSFIDTSVLAATNYCYAAYSHDARPVYSSGVSASVVTPGAMAIAPRATPSSGAAPLPVTYSTTISGGHGPFTYSWQMGSNPPDTSATPSTTWSTPGTYITTVTVTDADGLTANSNVSVTVGAPNPALTASASANPTTGGQPLSVAFTATPQGGSAPYTYTWDFKDGQSATQQNPSHSFASAGTYAVALTIRDNANANATANVSVTVTDVAAPGSLTATATAVPTSGPPPLPVQFTASASGGTAPYRYTWDFGDASALVVIQNPSHTYQNAGAYTATLTVNDASSNISKTVTVTASAGAALAAPTNFQGAAGNTTSLVTWTKAPSAAGTRIMRKLGSAPSGPSDTQATKVYEGTAGTYHDTGLLNNGSKYYYTAYSYDASATPVFSTSPAPVVLTITDVIPDITDGMISRVNDSGLVAFWRTAQLAEARVKLYDTNTNVLAVVGADAGDNESTLHEVTLSYPLQRGQVYALSVESISANPARVLKLGPNPLVGPYVDINNNYWFGVGYAGMLSAGMGWNGTNTPIIKEKCDNTCNQYYTCRATGVADCSDSRNTGINALMYCGNLAVADCLDGRKDLPSGGTGTLSASILQSWPRTRIPDALEFKNICNKWYQVPSSTGQQTRTQDPIIKEFIQIFGKGNVCGVGSGNNGVGSINAYDPRQIAPAGTWTP